MRSRDARRDRRTRRLQQPRLRRVEAGGRGGTLAHFGGRVWNTHPALLPAYGGQGMYGDRVHEAVLSAGDTVSGASVHLVTAEYDEGAVIAQTRVAVLPADDVASLGARVRAAERQLLVDTLRKRARAAT